jgi:serine/threonine protein kinase
MVSVADLMAFEGMPSPAASDNYINMRINGKRDRIKLLQIIGHGQYGVVYKACRESDKSEVAAKMVAFDEGERKEVMYEHNIASHLKHPNILSNYGSGLVSHNFVMVMDLMENSLHELIFSGDTTAIELCTVQSLSRQLLEGVAYMHARSIMHRDLKSANVLLTAGNTVLKIADFGMAVLLTMQRTECCHTRTRCTLCYRAPELLVGCKTYGVAVDAWSIGCIIGELIARRHLFRNEFVELLLLESIFKVLGSPSDEEWAQLLQIDVSKSLFHFRTIKPTGFPDFKGLHALVYFWSAYAMLWSAYACFGLLMLLLLLMHASAYACFCLCLHSPAGKNVEAGKLITSLLTVLPSRRLTCTDALKHPFFQTQFAI